MGSPVAFGQDVAGTEMFALLRLARGQISSCGPALAHDGSAE